MVPFELTGRLKKRGRYTQAAFGHQMPKNPKHVDVVVYVDRTGVRLPSPPPLSRWVEKKRVAYLDWEFCFFVLLHSRYSLYR